MSLLLLALGLGVVFAVLSVVIDPEDTLRAYPSPEVHEQVHEIMSSPSKLASLPANDGEWRDFDGDGTADQLSVEYFHMEPILRRTTSGLVQVHSGRTRELLLAHAVATPFNPTRWCGDADGNGTEDIAIEDEGRTRVLGFARSR